MKKRYQLLLLILIIILSAFLRIWNIDENPKGFFCDEASIGYNAYQLLTTGKDEWGKSWPLFIRAFGEYKSPIMTYSTIPFVAIFGLSEFSVRIVSAAYGALTVFVFYLLGKTIKDKNLGLYAAFLLSICPWHIHSSRTSLEGLTAMILFASLAINFWLSYWKERETKKIFLSIAFFALCLYSYFPARIIIPLLAIFLFVLDYKNLLKDKKIFVSISLFSLVLSLPLVFHTAFGPGLARWNQVNNQKTITQALSLYLNHFSPTFLFTKGDIDFPGQFITRHSIRGMGQLHLFQSLFIVLGLIYLYKNIKKRENKIIIALLFLYPLGTTLTNAPGPQATRSILGIIPLTLISALGTLVFINIIKKAKSALFKKLLKTLISIVILLSLFHQLALASRYPLYSADFWGWQSGPKQIIKYYKETSSDYDQLIIEGVFNSPEIFLKFYDPKNICKNCQIGGIDSISPNQKQLIALTTPSLEKLKSYGINYTLKKEIFYPNGDISFVILEINPRVQ